MTLYFLYYFFSEVKEESKQSWLKILNKGEKKKVLFLTYFSSFPLYFKITFLPDHTTATVRRGER